ncbi:MAG: VOC family protein [Actinomycetota bacterium]|nr:VOC family protein [Actinomycetota bacterium]
MTDSPTSERRETSIAPWLSVRGGTDAVDYYKATFGAAELHRVENEAGEIVAHLSIGDADFWISDEPSSSPEGLGGGSARMILTVEDPDRVFDQAVAAGATVVAAVYEGHGWRVGRLADPFGHHWEIGKPLPHAR